MNILVFVTDQQRAVQHFPRRWVERDMPGLAQLQRTGLTFDNAFTNACMCSPKRSTFLSGYFPAQHGVKYTLEENMPASEGYPQVPLPPTSRSGQAQGPYPGPPRSRTARTTWSASASGDTSWPATTLRIAPTSRISGRCTT